jgi:hypothetical protein
MQYHLSLFWLSPIIMNWASIRHWVSLTFMMKSNHKLRRSTNCLQKSSHSFFISKTLLRSPQGGWDPEGINNTSCIRLCWLALIKIIYSILFLTVVMSLLGSNMLLATTIRVTQQQANLIEWCTDEMLRVTDASMVQALNVCAEYYLKVEWYGRYVYLSFTLAILMWR